MKIYRVGGAVRDEVLGRPVKEIDWVVVGATPEEMLQKNFRQVGKDFPVFLHPETNEEYALARKERKVSKGYTGFTFDTSAAVTLEEDLKRRDFTINAMAQTDQGELIDPYHGKKDLENKTIRHVSEAFVEDPVRILRAARFAARFSDLGFTIADETFTLMKKMVAAGEVNALVADRVWKELSRAFTEKHPEKFFEVLENCGALTILFPENLNFQTLTKVAEQTDDPIIRFAALTYQLDESTLKKLVDRYHIPNDYRDLALLVIKFLSVYENFKTQTDQELLNLFQAADAFRRPERFLKFLAACKAITGKDQQTFFTEVLTAINKIDLGAAQHLSGKAIGEYIQQQRLALLKKFRS